jgi:hypothetical protein
MNKSCKYEEKTRNGALRDEDFKIHISGCAECRETQRVSDWMQKFAAQVAPPQNLRTPGFLLLKARVIEKQSAASRAVQPIFWMQIASILMIIPGIIWLEIKSDTPILPVLTGAFASLSSVAPIFFFGVISAALICFAFAYKIRGTKH